MSTSTVSATPTLAERLEPVRHALLADAADAADRIRATARDHVRSVTDAAEQEIANEVAEVAHRRATSAQAHAEQVRARARAEARAELLAASAEVHRDLLAAVRTAALELRDDERYPALLHQLEAIAHDQLGTDADVQVDPPEQGGVVAVAGTRRVDYTLPALAERALRDHADEVAALWA